MVISSRYVKNTRMLMKKIDFFESLKVLIASTNDINVTNVFWDGNKM